MSSVFPTLLFSTFVSLILSLTSLFTSFQPSFQVFPWIASLLVSVSYLTTQAIRVFLEQRERRRHPNQQVPPTEATRDGDGEHGTTLTTLSETTLEGEPIWIFLSLLTLLLSFLGLSFQGGSHYTLPLNTLLLSLNLFKANRLYGLLVSRNVLPHPRLLFLVSRLKPTLPRREREDVSQPDDRSQHGIRV